MTPALANTKQHMCATTSHPAGGGADKALGRPPPPRDLYQFEKDPTLFDGLGS